MIAADKETVEAEIQTLLVQVPRADLKPLEELGLGSIHQGCHPRQHRIAPQTTSTADKCWRWRG